MMLVLMKVVRAFAISSGWLNPGPCAVLVGI
jgi:hypothetical protein